MICPKISTKFDRVPATELPVHGIWQSYMYDLDMSIGKQNVLIYEIDLKTINEFLYYDEGVLVAYLGISSYGGSNIGEINKVDR